MDLATERVKDDAYSISSKSWCETAFLMIQPPATFIAATISFMFALFERTGTSEVFKLTVVLRVVQVTVVDAMLNEI